MMRRLAALLAGGLLIGSAPQLVAQTGEPGPRSAVLRDRIEEAFQRRVREELGLTDDQATRTARVLTAWAGRREAIESEERGLRAALAAQLRPGIAAAADSVSRLVDRMTSNRVSYMESFRDEMRDLTPILTPVQRGQFLLMRDRLLQRVREMQQQRAPAGGGRPPL